MLSELIPSIALIGSGAYLLSKSNCEKDTATKTPAEKDNDNVSAIISAHKESEVKSNANDTSSSYNARGEANVTDNSGNAISLKTSNKLYFGDKNAEYDQFYDYTDDANGFTTATAKGTTADPDVRGLFYRCRLVAPFMGQTEELKMGTDKRPIVGFPKSGFTMMGYQQEDGSVSSIENIMEYYTGKYRDYAFVMEVFNPYDIQSKLHQIVLRNIVIDGKLCQVYNQGGYIHYASAKQLEANKRLYFKVLNGVPSGKYKPSPYVYQCGSDGITINAKSSVLIPILLPLMVIDRFDVLNGTIDNSTINYGDTKQSTIANSYRLCTILNRCSAPADLSKCDIKMNVLISSGKDNYRYNWQNGKEEVENCQTFDLSMRHSYRNGYATMTSYQESYIGDAEGKTPSIATQGQMHDALQALGNNIYMINKGYPIEAGFPSETTAVKYDGKNGFAFSNDYNSFNLG